MPRPLHVLLVEDNPADAELVLRELQRAGLEPVWQRVDTEAAYLAQLHGGLDLVLSDYAMPTFSGLRALELLMQSGLDVPFILVSATIGEEMAVTALKQGAADYLMKDRLTRLGPAINHALEESRLRRERKRAEEALRLFRALVDQSNDIFEVIDPATARFLDVNEKGPADLGCSREEYLARRVFDIDPTLTAATWPQLVEKIRRQGKLSGEGVHRRQDGTTFPVEFSAKWVRLDRDYIVTAVRDITERLKLETQLRQSQKMEAIGQLSGGIAHDFNNLLTAITGHLGLLRGDPNVTPEMAESLGEINAAARRAATLTGQLLAFSRRQVISASALDLNEVVTNLTKMLRRILGEEVVVQLDYAPEQLVFHGDAGLMEQVLVNLAVNAKDAMPGGGTLRITTRSETRIPPLAASPSEAPEAGPFVRLSVSDTGTGIPEDIRPNIFEPFFTTKDVGKGTGLGLATVFGIVQQHHGWIEVDSETGRGTTFHIYLPRLASAPAAAVPTRAAPPGRGRNELVLLVEDEPSVQEMGTIALRRYGYRVLTASNGPAALKVWAGHKAEIALLLTDMIMPEGISGQQLARQLLAEKPTLKVVYTSGYNAASAGKEIELTDGVNYLAKPYELDRLFTMVRAALDGGRSRSPFAKE